LTSRYPAPWGGGGFILEAINLISIDNYTGVRNKVGANERMTASRSVVDVIEKSIKTNHLIPITAVYEVTKKCNLSCRHCYLGQNNSRGNELSLVQIETLLLELVDMGTINLALTGGDPFCREDFLDICEMARDMGFNITIATNGTQLTPQAIEQIAKLNIAKIIISMHATDPVIHDRFVGKTGAHETTINTINSLLSKEQKIVLYSSITKYNRHEHSKLNNYCIQHKIKYEPSVLMYPTIKGDMAPRKLMLEDNALLASLQYNYSYNTIESSPIPCGAGRKAVFISAEGSIQPCAVISKSAGSLLEKSFKSIWNNSEFLNEIRAITEEDYPECKICEYRDTCTVFCMGCNYLVNGNVFELDKVICSVAKHVQEIQYRKAKQALSASE